jgi:hypothetical protein
MSTYIRRPGDERHWLILWATGATVCKNWHATGIIHWGLARSSDEQLSSSYIMDMFDSRQTALERHHCVRGRDKVCRYASQVWVIKVDRVHWCNCTILCVQSVVDWENKIIEYVSIMMAFKFTVVLARRCWDLWRCSSKKMCVRERRAGLVWESTGVGRCHARCAHFFVVVRSVNCSWVIQCGGGCSDGTWSICWRSGGVTVSICIWTD